MLNSVKFGSTFLVKINDRTDTVLKGTGRTNQELALINFNALLSQVHHEIDGGDAKCYSTNRPDVLVIKTQVPSNADFGDFTADKFVTHACEVAKRDQGIPLQVYYHPSNDSSVESDLPDRVNRGELDQLLNAGWIV